METETEHPAERYATDVAVADRRAALAMGALALTAALRLFTLPLALWQNALLRAVEAGNTPPRATLELSDSLAAAGSIGLVVLLLVTAALFLRWLHKAVGLARALGAAGVPWTPREAVLGFIIPFVNLDRPYKVVRDVHDALAPDAVAEPPVQARVDAAMGYRQVDFRAPPPPVTLPHASIGAWWATFWIGNVLGNIAARSHGETIGALATRNYFNAAADAVEVVAAVLAVVMVRGLTARLRERYRRVRHTSAEALAAQGVVLE